MHSINKLALVLLAVLFLLPLVLFAVLLANPQLADVHSIWPHIRQYVLTEYAYNAVVIGAGSFIGTFIIGGASGVLVGLYEFPGRKTLKILLLAPLGLPTYLVTYAYALLPMPQEVTNLFYSQYGAILLFSICLYPYTYLTTLAVVSLIDQTIVDAAKTLGKKSSSIIFSVVFPATLAGCLAVVAEVLTDFGTVDYLGIPTFATGIYRAWVSLNSLWTAMAISLLLLAGVIVLVWLTAILKKSHPTLNLHVKITRQQVGWKGYGITVLLILPVLLGLILPVGLLSVNAFKYLAESDAVLNVWQPWLYSLMIGVIAAVIIVALGLYYTYAVKQQHGNIQKIFYALVSMLHILPAVTLGVLLTSSRLSSGIVIVLYACAIHFAAPCWRIVIKAQQQLPPVMMESARTLGAGAMRSIRKIEIPHLRTALLGSAALGMLEVIKELPIMLILRPGYLNTLAVQTYQLASDERLEQAAVYGLALAFTGILIAIFYAMLQDN